MNFFEKKLGSIYTYRLPESVKADLSKTPYEGIKCPCCGNVSHVRASKELVSDRLNEDKGFLCYFCFNSGNPHTDNSQVASSLYQHKDAIIEVINRTSLVPQVVNYLLFSEIEKATHQKDWFEYVSFEHSNEGEKVIISLPENEKIHSFTMLQWKRRLNSKLRQSEGSFSVDSYASRGIKATEHLSRLQKIHPKGKIIDLKPAKSLSTMHCGEVSVFKTGGTQIVVEHPNFELDVAKTQRRIDTGGNNACCCVICAIEKGVKTPKTAKDIGLANKLWEYYAAKVAAELGISDLSGISVNRLTETDESLNTTKEKLSFKCHNPEHEPIIDTYSNRLNPKRSGYCKECLKDAGVKNVAEMD